MIDWIKIENKFPANCIECNKEISIGEKCLWMHNLGIKHTECPTGIIEEDKSQLVIIEPDDPVLLGIK